MAAIVVQTNNELKSIVAKYYHDFSLFLSLVSLWQGITAIKYSRRLFRLSTDFSITLIQIDSKPHTYMPLSVWNNVLTQFQCECFEHENVTKLSNENCMKILSTCEPFRCCIPWGFFLHVSFPLFFIICCSMSSRYRNAESR